MTELILNRSWMLERHPTPGVLLVDNEPFCFTLERPWLGNQHDISCIPCGVYRCLREFHKLEHSKTPFETYRVENVPDRSGILFHGGNKAEDSKGCILLGINLTNAPHVSLLPSLPAFPDFMKKVVGDECMLEIRCCLPFSCSHYMVVPGK